ncbi:MAG: pseudouridine synthase [Eubacteriales bacterium]
MTRLNKYIAEAGICSRREADRMIESGRVTVDGVKATPGTQVEEGQVVRVGKKIIGNKNEVKKVVLLVNKPVGIVCTEEMKEKHNIIRFLKYPTRITYAGRLDKDSEGLLVMTNDGDLIQQMMRSANGHEKEYKVTVHKKITDKFIEDMSKGVRIRKEEKGKVIMDEVTRPCEVKKIGKYTFSIVLTQGLNRQIRRMSETLGYKVTSLKRVRIMNLELGNIKTGTYREATKAELDTLRAKLMKV